MKLIKGPKKITLVAGPEARTETGRMKADILEGKKPGDEFDFNKQRFRVLKPRFVDVFNNINRGPQIITLKDAAVICAKTGLGGGDRVLEAGAGSGALTIYLAHHVKPNGRVYSYEVRDDFLKIAEKNVEFAELSEWVELKQGDVYERIDETDLDVIVLDLPEPWQALDNARKALVPGGFLVCYIPTANQLIQLSEQNWDGFFDVYAMTSLHQYFQLKRGAVRPTTKGLAHTGYLLFARRS